MAHLSETLAEGCLGVGKGAPWVLYLAVCGVLLVVSLQHPEYLSDSGNPFLKGYLDNDILSVLGFVTAVGNAASLSIFLHLNKLEDETTAKFLRTRKSLRLSAVSLVVIFLIAFLALVLKSMIPSSPTSEALINSVGIACTLFSLSVLKDLTLTVFAIPTKKRIGEMHQKNSKKES